MDMADWNGWRVSRQKLKHCLSGNGSFAILYFCSLLAVGSSVFAATKSPFGFGNSLPSTMSCRCHWIFFIILKILNWRSPACFHMLTRAHQIRYIHTEQVFPLWWRKWTLKFHMRGKITKLSTNRKIDTFQSFLL